MTFVNFDGEPFAPNQMSVFFVVVTNLLTDTSVELGDGFVGEVRFSHSLFGRDLCGKTKKEFEDQRRSELGLVKNGSAEK